jgi:signal transduction histidine kinase
LIGLQSNALKFTRKGEVKHLISIYEENNSVTNKKDKYLKIKVMDTGIGIEKKD